MIKTQKVAHLYKRTLTRKRPAFQWQRLTLTLTMTSQSPLSSFISLRHCLMGLYSGRSTSKRRVDSCIWNISSSNASSSSFAYGENTHAHQHPSRPTKCWRERSLHCSLVTTTWTTSIFKNSAAPSLVKQEALEERSPRCSKGESGLFVNTIALSIFSLQIAAKSALASDIYRYHFFLSIFFSLYSWGLCWAAKDETLKWLPLKNQSLL